MARGEVTPLLPLDEDEKRVCHPLHLCKESDRFDISPDSSSLATSPFRPPVLRCICVVALRCGVAFRSGRLAVKCYKAEAVQGGGEGAVEKA